MSTRENEMKEHCGSRDPKCIVAFKWIVAMDFGLLFFQVVFTAGRGISSGLIMIICSCGFHRPLERL